MKIYKFLLLILTIILSAYLYFSFQSSERTNDSNEVLEGVITGLSQQENIQNIDVKISKGSLKEQIVTLQEDQDLFLNRRDFHVGDKVLVENNQEQNQMYISDYIRSDLLLWLFVVFIAVILISSGWQGVGSLLGMVISFIVIFRFSLPAILDGIDPVQVAIFSSLAIIPATFFSAHGINKKTSAAVIATTITMVLAGLVSTFVIDWANLTGLASEEAAFLKIGTAEKINFQGLLLAGMLIGILGVLDDITVSQASVVHQLKESKPSISMKELFVRSMNVGRDHIASMVNTIILIYTGAALPLLLLFADYSEPISKIINIEPVAEEIIRTLIGTIVLILAVPMTSLIAALMYKKTR